MGFLGLKSLAEDLGTAIPQALKTTTGRDPGYNVPAPRTVPVTSATVSALHTVCRKLLPANDWK